MGAGATIKVGDDCGFSGTALSSVLQVTLGNRVRCGVNSRITDNDAHPDDPRVGNAAPVVIEDDVWIGAGSYVMKGVTIRRGTLIGTNSVVLRDLPEYVIAAGTPAKPLRDLTPTEVKNLQRNQQPAS